MPDAAVIARFRAARRDPALVVLEGLHAVKHALRFEAMLLEAYTSDTEALAALARALAPDVAGTLATLVRRTDGETYAALTPLPVDTGVVALAARPKIAIEAILAGRGPIVLLDRPRHLGNLGAVIRVAAAADAAGVVALGDADPFHPTAVRGGAGLQFALPCVRAAGVPSGARPLIGFTDDGAPLIPERLPANAVLAFGSERHGLAAEIRARSDALVAIPMRAGVSSLNLATAVAIGLYASRLG